MKVALKFLGGLALGFTAALALNAAVFALALGVPTELSRWTFDVNTKKQLLGKASSPPRLLLVGGSSVLFGLDARLIEGATGWRTLNLGTHAGLGPDYILREARAVAKPGDTVLLALEYELYDSGKIEAHGTDSVFIDYVVARDPEYFRELPWLEKWNALALTSTQRLKQALRNRFNPGRYPAKGAYTTVYNPDYIDAWGDQTHHSRAAVPAHFEWRETLLSRGLPKNPEGFPTISSFCLWAKERRIRVLATWPPLLDQPSLRSRQAREGAAEITRFFTQLGVPVVGKYTEALLPRDQFFNTVYHLTGEGAVAHTERLLEKLKPFLK